MTEESFFSPLPNLVCVRAQKATEWFSISNVMVYQGGAKLIKVPTCPHCYRSVISQIEAQVNPQFNKWHTVMTEDEFIEWKLTHE